MSNERPPEVEPTDNPGSFLTRVGTAIFAGAIAAAVSVVPAVLRVGAACDARFGAIGVWLSLTACWVVPGVGAVVVFRSARDGLRAFGGPSALARGTGALLWVLTILAALCVAGSTLRAKTHQHALAGVTFALLALAFAFASALVAARIASLVAQTPHPLQIALFVASVALACGALLYVSVSLARGPDQDSGAASTALDLLALAIAAGFVSRRWLSGLRVLGVLGPPVAAIFLLLGILTARGSSDLPETVRDRAPAFAPAVELVTGR